MIERSDDKTMQFLQRIYKNERKPIRFGARLIPLLLS